MRPAGGMSSTFDLLVHRKAGPCQEFSNLAKAELGPIMGYIDACGLQIGSPEEVSAAAAAGAASEQQAEEGDSSAEVRLRPVGPAMLVAVTHG